jgi:xanthine dehydrogenase small subunit
MSTSFEFWLNGSRVQVAGVDPNTTLLAYLRARGLTGTKESCAEGECGACAVVVLVAAANGRSAYQAVNSCLVLLPEVAECEVWTVEGVRQDRALHPVQQAMVEHGGSQCGYCTPGFVMSLFAYYYSEPRPQPMAALSGNLCRCTGYRPIRDAAAQLPAAVAGDAFRERLQRAAPVPTPLQHRAGNARFDRPTALQDALVLRAEFPSATLLSGGTDVVVEINQAGSHHEHVIALGGVRELRAIEERDGEVVIGAGVTWAQLESDLRGRLDLLAQVIPLFGSPLIRARATLGGNLMTASPVGDGAPALLALDAAVELASANGNRSVPLREFFTGYRRTALRSEELLVAVRVAKRPPSVARFYKVSKRELDDIASVSAAFAVWLDGGRVQQAAFAFGGVAATPARAFAAEQALVGQRLDDASLRTCQRAVAAAFTPIDDVRASAAYRSAMLTSLLAKFWAEAS